jgi:hypothetical protein
MMHTRIDEGVLMIVEDLPRTLIDLMDASHARFEQKTVIDLETDERIDDAARVPELGIRLPRRRVEM